MEAKRYIKLKHRRDSMLVSEEEAQRKWCPFARVSDGTQIADTQRSTFNRHFEGQGSGACYCIGSACMAWREVALAPDEAPKGFCRLIGE